MKNVKYSYIVVITADSDILKDGPFGNAIPNVNEMIVSSKVFDNFNECEQAYGRIMNHLAKVQSAISGRNHVIMSKRNPSYDESGEVKETTEVWDKLTIYKSYVADFLELKQSRLKSDVIGYFKIHQGTLDQLNVLQPKVAQ